MVILFQYILSAVFVFKILTTNGLSRFGWYMASITLVNTFFNVFNAVALTKGHLFFVLLFFISLIIEGRLKIKQINKCPLAVPLLLLFISYVLIGLFDSRLNPVVGVYRGTYNFLQSFGAFLLGWLSVKENVNLSALAKKLTYLALIFTIYGVITFLMKSNPIVDALGFEDRFVFENAKASFRQFLVAGFLAESGVYGLSCFLFLIYIVAFYRYRRKLLVRVATVLLFVNIFLTATRSVMIPAMVGMMIYIMIAYNFKDKTRVIFVSVFIGLVVTVVFPNSIAKYAGEVISSIADVILPGGSGGADLGGSNMDVRQIQIATAFTKYLPQRPFFGHGFNYYQEVIYQFNNGVNDAELYGMESYLCFLGVEYGVVNIICVIVFFISLLRYFIKNKSVGKIFYAIGLSITVTYILFLVFAYMGDSWLYAMPFLGLIVGVIEKQKQYKKSMSM